MALTEEQQADIKAQSSQQLYTKRPISPGLEEMLYQAFPVLDHVIRFGFNSSVASSTCC